MVKDGLESRRGDAMPDTNTFITIDADKGGTIEFPIKYTIVNRIVWKIVAIFTPVKVRWFW